MKDAALVFFDKPKKPPIRRLSTHVYSCETNPYRVRGAILGDSSPIVL